MARYIDADKLCEALKSMASVQYPDKQNTILGVVSSIENFPAADVVPKIEVESILDGLMKEAREIAERYEKSANETSDYDYARIEYRGCQMGALLVLFKIAELKKKYTEVK